MNGCFFKELFFFEYQKLFKGERLEKEEMFPLPTEISALNSLARVQRTINWNRVVHGKIIKDIQDLLVPIIKKKMIASIILKAVESIVILCLSVMPRFFIPQITGSYENRNIMVIVFFPIIAFVLGVSRYVLSEHSAKFVNRSSASSGQAIRAIIFDKIAKLNISFLQNADESLISKMVMFNLSHVLNFIGDLPDLFSFPLILFFSVITLYLNLGSYSLIVPLVFLIAWILITIMIRRIVRLELSIEFFSSKRILYVIESLSKFKSIKAEGFEAFYKKKIEQARIQEILFSKRMGMMNSLVYFLVNLSGVLSIVLIQLAHYVANERLGIAKMATVVSIISSMQTPLIRFAKIFEYFHTYNHARRSLNYFLYQIPDKPKDTEIDERLMVGTVNINNCEAIMESDEKSKESIRRIFSNSTDEKQDDRGSASDLSAFRLSTQQIVVSPRFNLSIKRNDKICILTPHGQNIDILLYTIMGETEIRKGRAYYRGECIFEDARNGTFLVGETLRNNILMGEDMIASRYNKILNIIGLQFSKFQGGDLIEVREDASNFSSSEKRKILLARMLYISGDIYIMKNFFGQDEIQAEIILFRRLIKGLLADKTVIFTCPRLEIAELSDQIIVEDQRTNEVKIYKSYHEFRACTPEQSMKNSSRILKSARSHERSRVKRNSHISNSFTKKVELLVAQNRLISRKAGRMFTNFSQVLSGNKKRTGQGILSVLSQGIQQAIKKKADGKLVKIWDEQAAFKNLKTHIYRYCTNRGTFLMILQALLCLVSVMLYIMSDIWVGVWSTNYLSYDTIVYVEIFLGIAVVSSIASAARMYLFNSYLLQNAEKIHKHLIDTFFKLHIGWLIEHPTVQIGYKLSYDMNVLDRGVNEEIQGLLESLFFCLGGLLILNYVYLGLMLLVMLFLGVLFERYLRAFSRASLPLITFITDNTSRLQETYNIAINEMLSYRLLRKEHLIYNKFYATSDELQRAITHFHFYAKRWLGVRLGLINSILISAGYFMPITVVYLFSGLKQLTPLEVALSFIWSLKIVDFVNRFIKIYLALICDIVSCARMVHFCDKAKVERSSNVVVSQGQLRIEDICKAKNLKLTLGKHLLIQNISIDIEKSQTIAILGDSGSGKHLLSDLLTKIYEPDEESGSLILFGEDSKKIDPYFLRRQIGVLKDTPVIFTGTLRDNIDPYNEKSNVDIIKCLLNLEFAELWRNEITERIKQFLNSDDFPEEESELDDSEHEDRIETKETSKPLVTEANTNIKDSVQLEQLKLIHGSEVTHLQEMLKTELASNNKYLSIKVQRMIKLARIMLQSPKLVIADQGAIDLWFGNNGHNLSTLLKKFPSTSFLIILTTFEAILSYDKIYLFEEGKVVSQGPGFELLKGGCPKIMEMIRKKDNYLYAFLKEKVNKRIQERLKDGFLNSYDGCKSEYQAAIIDEDIDLEESRIQFDYNQFNIPSKKGRAEIRRSSWDVNNKRAQV